MSNVIRIQAALSDVTGTQSLFVSHADDAPLGDSSSLMRPTLHTTLYPATTFDAAEDVKAYRLVDLLDEFKLPSPTVLRLDLQGMEERVLRDALPLIPTVEVVMSEVSRIPMYDGAATFDDVARLMKSMGFDIVIDRVGALTGNVLFVRGTAS